MMEGNIMRKNYCELQRSIYFQNKELLNEIDEWAKELGLARSDLICRCMKSLLEMRKKAKEGGQCAKEHI